MQLLGEVGKVLDPGQAASEETEQALQSSLFGLSKPLLDSASDSVDDPETPMAESNPDGWWERETEAGEAMLRSWDRQFDTVEGGGFSDEARAVIDPSRSSSPATEQRLRETSGGNPIGPNIDTISYDLSDDLDREGGVTPPPERDPQPETTPDGDGNLFSGADPTDPDDPGYPDELSWLLDNIEVVIAAIVVLYALSVSKPIFEIVAQVTE